MKLYGYKNEGLPIEQIEPVELAEITLVATPDELGVIADFLKSAASNMEELGKKYVHEHLSDVRPDFKGSPHFVVFNSKF